jgi:hypothetical protein
MKEGPKNRKYIKVVLHELNFRNGFNYTNQASEIKV